MDIFQQLDVSRETIARLEHFAELTKKWTPRINLIALSTVNDIWSRHIIDSAQLYQFAPQTYDSWADLGSGGGFPGIVMSAIAHEKQPNAKFTLIESDQRKSTFLRTAIREMSLGAKVIADRIEHAGIPSVDVISARALASLENLLPLIQDKQSPDGIALLHKGRQWRTEILDAKRNWVFEVEDHPSMTDAEARILKISRIARV